MRSGIGNSASDPLFVSPTGGGTGTSASQVQGTAADGAAAVGNPVPVAGKDGSGNVQSVLTGTDGSVFVQGTAGGTPLVVGGAVASGATDSGNPVKVGGVYNTTQPTLTNGQRGDAQLNSRGEQLAQVSATSLTPVDGLTNVGTGFATPGQPTAARPLLVFPQVYSGSAWALLRGDTSGLITQPHALTGSRWGYAAATGGISNTTTAVTIAAAAGGSLRNYITGIQINATALGAGTELAIRDGAGGTVLWRTQIGTAGIDNAAIVFPVPLKGTANTLLEVVTLTASVTGAVYFNAQGYTAA